MKFLDELASRRRFGMKPGLATMREICRRLGDPQRKIRTIHVAGTNGKGAVCAMLDAVLGGGRYTSPHLVNLNERFFLKGMPVSDGLLERAAARVAAVAPEETTFFEALTAVAFEIYAATETDPVVLETGLGGRLDATNVCQPELAVITRIGLDHCDWLGDTVEAIAAEKAGIVKPGVPIVLGANSASVRSVVEARAKEVGAPFHFAPDLADESELPDGFALRGRFNRENGITALAALKVLFGVDSLSGDRLLPLTRVVWPGRFQTVGDYLVDGAHNPPAARALSEALSEILPKGDRSLSLVAGFCGDKDVKEVLSILSPFIARGFSVRTANPRSLAAAETALLMESVGIPADVCSSLDEALRLARDRSPSGRVLVCGSLFLAGEALVALGASPWGQSPRFDAAELLRPADSAVIR